MVCCKALRYDDWCLDVPTAYKDEESKEYCIFHAPIGKKGADADIFKTYVFDRINSKYPLSKRLQFSGTCFEGDIDFSNRPMSFSFVDFKDAEFSGDVNFFKVVFGDAADFSGAIFRGEAYFVETATFETHPDFLPVSWVAKIACKLLIPIQAALLALSIRNKYRR